MSTSLKSKHESHLLIVLLSSILDKKLGMWKLEKEDAWKSKPLHVNIDALVYLRLYIFIFRDVYVSTMQPQSKHVVIMMDHGNSLSATQMLMARSIARNLIASFTENDRVSLPSCYLITRYKITFHGVTSLKWWKKETDGKRKSETLQGCRGQKEKIFLISLSDSCHLF